MTIIREWTKDDAGEEFYIRNAVSYPGPIIYMGGMRPGLADFMSRRWVAIDARGVDIRKVVFSVAYNSGFDSNNPFEVHKKYREGEVVTLMSVPHAGDLESALAWPGVIQRIND